MTKIQITKDTTVGELLKRSNAYAPILLEMGLHCLGCPSAARETVEGAAIIHGIKLDEILEKLNAIEA
jgi:hybrid cluster-associated redox disulfide protein